MWLKADSNGGAKPRAGDFLRFDDRVELVAGIGND